MFSIPAQSLNLLVLEAKSIISLKIQIHLANVQTQPPVCVL